MGTSSYKTETTEMSVADAISSGYGELGMLRDEMSEWASNMDDNGLGATPKYEEVSAASEALDGFVDNEPELGSLLAALGSTVVSVSQQVNRRKARGPSRSVRASNAVACLEAARDAAQGLLEAHEKDEASDTNPSDDLQALIDELDQAIDDGGSVDFPGMY